MHRTSAGSMQTEWQYEEERWAQSLPTTAKELLVTDSSWERENQFSSTVNDIPAKAAYPWVCGQNKIRLKANNQTQNWVGMGSEDGCGRKEDK